MSRSRSWLWALPLVLAACTKPAPEPAAAPAIDSAAVTAAAATFWQTYGQNVLAGDTTAWMTMVDDSIRVDSRGLPPLIGKAAVVATFMPVLRITKYTGFNVTPDMTIPISNEAVYQNGNYMEASTSGGKSQTEYGRYAVAIVKGADGQWRLGYIMSFSDSVVSAKK